MGVPWGKAPILPSTGEPVARPTPDATGDHSILILLCQKNAASSEVSAFCHLPKWLDLSRPATDKIRFMQALRKKCEKSHFFSCRRHFSLPRGKCIPFA